jgi:hypothetical protein
MAFTPIVGKKFNADGSFRRYPGLTVICKIDPSSLESHVLRECQSRFESLPFANKFSFLPQSSFHMTAIELVNDQARTPELWSRHLPLDSSMTDVDEFITRAWKNLEKISGPRMTVHGFKTESTLGIHVEPSDEEQSENLKKFRDRAADATGVRKPGHDTYRFHITYAYKLEHLSDDENRRLLEESAVASEFLKGEIPVLTPGSPELCFYNDMSAFFPSIKR